MEERSIDLVLQFYIDQVVFKHRTRAALRDIPGSGFGYYLSPALPYAMYSSLETESVASFAGWWEASNRTSVIQRAGDNETD